MIKKKFKIGDTIYDQEGGYGKIIDITDTHYVCDTMCVPIELQDEYAKVTVGYIDLSSINNGVTYDTVIDPIVYDDKEQLLENAIDFILETQKDNEYICEENGEWCQNNCIDTLRKNCIIHYLKEVYKK